MLYRAKEALSELSVHEPERQYVQEQCARTMGELMVDVAIMCVGGEEGTWVDIREILADAGVNLPASSYTLPEQLERMMDEISEESVVA